MFSADINPHGPCISSDTLFLVLFLVVHILMVCLAGFRNRMRGMITGKSLEKS